MQNVMSAFAWSTMPTTMKTWTQTSGMTCSWCAARAGGAHRSSQQVEREAAARYSGDCTAVSGVPNAGASSPSVVVPIAMLLSMCESASPIRDLNQSSQMYDAHTHPHQSPPHPHPPPHLEYTAAPAPSSCRRVQRKVTNSPSPCSHSHFPETL